MKEYLVPISLTGTVTVRFMRNDDEEAIDKATDKVWFHSGIWDAKAPNLVGEAIKVESSDLAMPPLCVE